MRGSGRGKFAECHVDQPWGAAPVRWGLREAGTHSGRTRVAKRERERERERARERERGGDNWWGWIAPGSPTGVPCSEETPNPP